MAPKTLHAFLIVRMPLTHEVVEQIINNTETNSKPSQPKPAGISIKCIDHKPAASQTPVSEIIDQTTNIILSKPVIVAIK